jgi:hypothetical protein
MWRLFFFLACRVGYAMATSFDLCAFPTEDRFWGTLDKHAQVFENGYLEPTKPPPVVTINITAGAKLTYKPKFCSTFSPVSAKLTYNAVKICVQYRATCSIVKQNYRFLRVSAREFCTCQILLALVGEFCGC